MTRVGALSGRGEILIGGMVRGPVSYAIVECDHRDAGDRGRAGRIAGEDALLREIWDHAFDVQLSCASGLFELYIGSHVLGSGEALVSLAGSPSPS